MYVLLFKSLDCWCPGFDVESLQMSLCLCSDPLGPYVPGFYIFAVVLVVGYRCDVDVVCLTLDAIICVLVVLNSSITVVVMFVV